MRITDNAGGQGGAVHISEYASAAVTNCLFAGNTSSFGGVIIEWAAA